MSDHTPSTPDGGAPLDGTAVQEVAARVAAELPDVTLSRPFGPEHNVHKVAGKVFCISSEATGRPITTLKCDPEHARALRQEFDGITAGYHVNKQHWISVAGGPGVTAQLVEELVLDSYALVVVGMPRHVRPALPDEVRRRLGGADPGGAAPRARPARPRG
ncbi:MmcQ/YjbR family DNA-binding protein [Kineococcus arenarius]|uniref:MmcQ/YjbR family DNA-binding protein n=1 Tax=unclassified Kineococcus TaxID=2621656 RepID=UPI003D7EFFDF